jgi:hypothetical protein
LAGAAPQAKENPIGARYEIAPAIRGNFMVFFLSPLQGGGIVSSPIRADKVPARLLPHLVGAP